MAKSFKMSKVGQANTCLSTASFHQQRDTTLNHLKLQVQDIVIVELMINL